MFDQKDFDNQRIKEQELSLCSDEYPEIDISFRYDENELNKVIRIARGRIRKKKAEEISDGIWKFEYAARILFLDDRHNDIIYPEQLLGIDQVEQCMLQDGEYTAKKMNIVYKLFYKRPKVLRVVYQYYKEHKNEINSRVFFV